MKLAREGGLGHALLSAPLCHEASESLCLHPHHLLGPTCPKWCPQSIDVSFTISELDVSHDAPSIRRTGITTRSSYDAPVGDTPSVRCARLPTLWSGAPLPCGQSLIPQQIIGDLATREAQTAIVLVGSCE